MQTNTINLKIQVSDLDTKKKFAELINSVEDFKIQDADSAENVDLLIYELGDNPHEDFEYIQSLLKAGAVGEVFLTAASPHPEILVQAMRLGIKEYFSQPLKDDDIVQALQRFKTRYKPISQKTAQLGKIISVIGSKGGVGTTIAANLAVSLNALKNVQSVALVDMNTMFGEIALLLEITPKHHWGDIVENIARLDATYLMKALSKHSTGLHVLTSPGNFNTHAPATLDVVAQILSLMQQMFDFIIIDGGHSVKNISLGMLKMSESILLISELSVLCLSNTNILLKSFADVHHLRDRIKIVINRYVKKSTISLETAEESLKKKIFWHIPDDYATTLSAINQGKPLTQIAPRAEITRNLNDLAHMMVAKEVENMKKQGKSAANQWNPLKRGFLKHKKD